MKRRDFLLYTCGMTSICLYDIGRDQVILWDQWNKKVANEKEVVWQCYDPNRRDSKGGLIPRYILLN